MAGAQDLFEDYRARIGHFAPVSVAGRAPEPAKRSAALIWLCHPGKSARMFSSENLAQMLEKYLTSGVREWQIGIGGADGFSDEYLRSSAPDVLWSLGPATLPHELAAVVASEQIYRAFTILKKLPYHSGH